jgi:hemolysin III
MQRGEVFNSVSHIVGATAALAGGAVLVALAAAQGDPWRVVSFGVYAATLFLLYLVSSLYHGLRGRSKAVFRVFDHQAIYLLIAGTYTPFSLISLRASVGWWVFGTIWGIALIGVVLEALPQRGRRVIPLLLYILMGWLVLLALDRLLARLPAGGFTWLLAGGVLYTAGVLFFLLSDRLSYAHGIWHLFVLAGSVSHYFAILFYL